MAEETFSDFGFVNPGPVGGIGERVVGSLDVAALAGVFVQFMLGEMGCDWEIFRVCHFAWLCLQCDIILRVDNLMKGGCLER